MIERTSTNKMRLEKAMLAKILAGENLTVVHDPSAETAMFNMKTRELTLPVWKDMEGDTFDLLCGHEVGHALFTPAGEKPFLDAIAYIDPDPKNRGIAHSFINITEDVRIEKLIRKEYPGLVKPFFRAYKKLYSTGLFGQESLTSLNSMGFPDRANIYFKVYPTVDVKFSEEEQDLVDRLKAANTWEETVKLTKEFYEFCKKNGQTTKSTEERDSGGRGKKKCSGVPGGQTGSALGEEIEDDENSEFAEDAPPEMPKTVKELENALKKMRSTSYPKTETLPKRDYSKSILDVKQVYKRFYKPGISTENKEILS